MKTQSVCTTINAILYGIVIIHWLTTSGISLQHATGAVQVIQVYVEAILITAFFSIIQLFIMTYAIVAGNETNRGGK